MSPWSSLPACSSRCPSDAVRVDAPVRWWPWAEATGRRCPELPVLVTMAGAMICGAAHILGRLSRAQRVLFLCLCCCLVAVALPAPVGTRSLCRAGAGYGEVQWFSADLRTTSASHPALRTKHPVLNSGCPDRLRKIMLPNSGPHELLWIYQDEVHLCGLQLPLPSQGSRAACSLVCELLERGRSSCA